MHARATRIAKLLASLALLAGGIGVGLVGCAAPPVYAVNDTDKPTGHIDNLQDLMAGTDKMRLIIVHGVGDHCPGYAVGDTAQPDGTPQWFNDKALNALHMRFTDQMVSQTIPAPVIYPGSEPAASVVVTKRHYSLSPPGLVGARPIAVEAIEVTWSPLTQWVKRMQLGQDFTQDPPKQCGGPTIKPATGVRPPGREWLNQLVKESTLDLDLADAILYMGNYGTLMERGLAEAICHGVTDTPGSQACHWPQGAQAEADPYRYMIVTHSLGSRMVYDMLLNLQGVETVGRPSRIPANEVNEAADFAKQMLGKLNGVYMFANQLPMLGLANFELTGTVTQGPEPEAIGGVLERATPADVMVLPKVAMQLQGVGKSPFTFRRMAGLSEAVADFPQLASCRNTLGAFGVVRDSQAQRLKDADPTKATLPLQTMNIIAFNDTNDLLTWHLPSWYTVDGNGQNGNEGNSCQPRINIENVFVRNSYVLPVIVEHPLKAHVGYYGSKSVWDAIACGATAGRVKDCQ